MPDQHTATTCGATTRAGTPCQRRDLHASGRCRLHGGLSTGPTTEDGKAKMLENLSPRPHEGSAETIAVPCGDVAPPPAPAAPTLLKPTRTWAETVELFERWKAQKAAGTLPRR